ncbi:DUF6300 family protein [Streptomyces sp. NPDC046984]|uniref:DUF6300 family protein n=1 Tax=Streptomyces sp. NPDC046984 TaxID=3155138 RepID=UPI0033C9260F
MRGTDSDSWARGHGRAALSWTRTFVRGAAWWSSLRRLPQCSRCRGYLLISAVMPQDDEQGWPIHLELCAFCDLGDAARSAACFLV